MAQKKQIDLDNICWNDIAPPQKHKASNITIVPIQTRNNQIFPMPGLQIIANIQADDMLIWDYKGWITYKKMKRLLSQQG